MTNIKKEDLEIPKGLENMISDYNFKRIKIHEQGEVIKITKKETKYALELNYEILKVSKRYLDERGLKNKDKVARVEYNIRVGKYEDHTMIDYFKIKSPLSK